MTKLHDFLHRLADAPAEALIGLLLVAVTVGGLLGVRYLVRSILRVLAFDAVLLGTTLLWWLSNSRLEGRVLISFTPNHGLTLGDTLGFPGLVLAGGLFIAACMRRPTAGTNLREARH